MPQTRRTSRDAALVELQRLHAAILASRARRGVSSEGEAAGSAEGLAAQELTRRLQTENAAATTADGSQEVRPSRGLWWVALAAAVVVAGAWVAMSLSQRPEVVTEAAPPRSGSSPAPAAPAATEPATSTPAPARPLQVTLTTIRPVWLRVIVDGSRAMQREVPAGETLSFAADRAVIVRSGDAGGVHATVNGTDRGALGLRGWPLTVAITPARIEPLTPTRPEP